MRRRQGSVLHAVYEMMTNVHIRCLCGFTCVCLARNRRILVAFALHQPRCSWCCSGPCAIPMALTLCAKRPVSSPRSPRAYVNAAAVAAVAHNRNARVRTIYEHDVTECLWVCVYVYGVYARGSRRRVAIVGFVIVILCIHTISPLSLSLASQPFSSELYGNKHAAWPLAAGNSLLQFRAGRRMPKKSQWHDFLAQTVHKRGVHLQ